MATRSHFINIRNYQKSTAAFIEIIPLSCPTKFTQRGQTRELFKKTLKPLTLDEADAEARSRNGVAGVLYVQTKEGIEQTSAVINDGFIRQCHMRNNS
jgi:hypothetical protein